MSSNGRDPVGTSGRLRKVALALVMVTAMVAGACSAETTLTVSESPTAVATPEPPPPTATPVPPVPTAEPPTPVPPTPVPPTPVPEPTAVPPPTLEPIPTEVPTPSGLQSEQPVSALGRVRSLADLPPGGPVYDDYEELEDDDGYITVTVPVAWSDRDTSNWTVDGDVVGSAISAAPSLTGYREEWGVPGVFVGASGTLPFDTVEDFLDSVSFDESCTYEGRRDYDDGVYLGRFDLYVDCGPERSTLVQIAAAPESGAYLIEVQMIAANENDWDAIATVIDTFLAELPVS